MATQSSPFSSVGGIHNNTTTIIITKTKITYGRVFRRVKNNVLKSPKRRFNTLFKRCRYKKNFGRVLSQHGPCTSFAAGALLLRTQDIHVRTLFKMYARLHAAGKHVLATVGATGSRESFAFGLHKSQTVTQRGAN